MNNNLFNKQVIKRIAVALGELNNDVVYVGRATVGLYVNDEAADDVRPTKDVDITLSLATVGELEQIREALYKKGFIQKADDDVICRFRYDDIIVDVMNTKALAWAPANPWFAPGFALRKSIIIDEQIIQILPLPYFLATKFAAYNGRGGNDPRISQDFEDIVYILDNRTDFLQEIQAVQGEVRSFLKGEFFKILTDKQKQEAIEGNLFFKTREQRFNKILQLLKLICNEIE
jgi:hypothetical protein